MRSIAAFNRRWNERYIATFFLCLAVDSLILPDHPLRALFCAALGFVWHGLVSELPSFLDFYAEDHRRELLYYEFMLAKLDVGERVDHIDQREWLKRVKAAEAANDVRFHVVRDGQYVLLVAVPRREKRRKLSRDA